MNEQARYDWYASTLRKAGIAPRPFEEWQGIWQNREHYARNFDEKLHPRGQPENKGEFAPKGQAGQAEGQTPVAGVPGGGEAGKPKKLRAVKGGKVNPISDADLHSAVTAVMGSLQTMNKDQFMNKLYASLGIPETFGDMKPAHVEAIDKIGEQLTRLQSAGVLQIERHAPYQVRLYDSTPRQHYARSAADFHADLMQALDSAAEATDTDPSEDAKAAGNYRKGKVWLHGLQISIENPKGSMRRGIGPGGTWESEMKGGHYGYIKRTESEADGDHVDVTIGPHPESEIVFVIDQTKPPAHSHFDEHKCMLGYLSAREAKEAYLSNYQSGWGGFEAITPMTIEQFKEWLHDGDTGRRVAEQYARKAAPGQRSMFNEEDHPRAEAGDEHGGEFVRKDNGREDRDPSDSTPDEPEEETETLALDDIGYEWKRGQVEVQYDLHKGVGSKSTGPILVDENNNILDGAHRLEEARARGDSHIKVRRISRAEHARLGDEALGIRKRDPEHSRSGEEFEKWMDEHYYNRRDTQHGSQNTDAATDPGATEGPGGQAKATAAEEGSNRPTRRARDAEFAPTVWEAVQAKLDAGESVTVATQMHAWRIGPKNRNALRFHNGEVQISRGRNWDTIGFGTLDQLGHQVGLDRQDVDLTDEEIEADRQRDLAQEEEGRQEAERERRHKEIAEKHFGGDERKATDSWFDAEDAGTSYEDWAGGLEAKDDQPAWKTKAIADLPDMTLYRGTGREGGAPNDHGVAGKGEYWSAKEQTARAYGPQVKTDKIKLDKPLVMTYAELNELQKGLYGRFLTGFEPELSEKFDQWMRDQGYDGAILYEHEGDVPSEVVKLAPKGEKGPQAQPEKHRQSAPRRERHSRLAEAVAERYYKTSPQDAQERFWKGAETTITVIQGGRPMRYSRKAGAVSVEDLTKEQ